MDPVIFGDSKGFQISSSSRKIHHFWRPWLRNWCFSGCQVAAPTWTHTRSYRTFVTFNWTSESWIAFSYYDMIFTVCENKMQTEKHETKLLCGGMRMEIQQKMNAYGSGSRIMVTNCPFSIHWFKMMIQLKTWSSWAKWLALQLESQVDIPQAASPPCVPSHLAMVPKLCEGLVRSSESKSIQQLTMNKRNHNISCCFLPEKFWCDQCPTHPKQFMSYCRY